MDSAFTTALVAAGPHASLGNHAQTYARVIGTWRGELKNYLWPAAAGSSVEAHFAWVLEGRAVQDVWITPGRAQRVESPPTGLNWYGTTLRVFEPTTEIWRAVWTDPASQLRIELEGRGQGEDIVQLGMRGGRPIRWTFSDIRDRSFTWQGHILEPDGSTWRLEIDIGFQRL